MIDVNQTLQTDPFSGLHTILFSRVSRLIRLDIVKKYAVDALLLSIALVATGVNLYGNTLHAQQVATPREAVLGTIDETSSRQVASTIHVEVSGAVNAPDVFAVSQGARLDDVIVLAGGYSDQAATDFISRNFNLSKNVTDQEKIYIPSLADIEEGIFHEDPKILSYLGQTVSADTSTQVEQSGIISINTASSGELDMLPGIGPTTAQKIIDGRPYNETDDLLTRKIVKASVYEQIKSMITR